ncbi:DUF4352 domain-containing protein [Sphaerisporangium sp. NPDC049002]|uniref:DUF4352 domain-containing protein n=1 Tax=Sphaerisporangium sp. NPDC049002 TaxID=3155392 RepID=UPI0033D729CE
MAYQQGPPGQPPYYGPPGGYGYPPPQPPHKPGKGPLFWIFVIGLPLVLLFSCTAALVAIGNSAPELVEATAPPASKPARTGDEVSTQPAETAETTQPPAETQPAAATVGSTISLEGADSGLKVDVTVTKVTDPATPANDIIKPKTGARYVAVELRLDNKGQGVYSDAPSNGARLIDDQGQQYNNTFGEVREGVLLSAVTVSPGDSRKGVILYEIPDGVKLAKFQFALNSGFADQKGEWTLK